MPILYDSTECWKIEKTNLAHNLHCYSFTCPCLFNVEFSSDLYNSSLLFNKLANFDKALSKKSLWVIFKNDVSYHAILLSEEVMTNDREKINKYLKVLNVEMQAIRERHVHIFSKIFDSSTNKTLTRSIVPRMLSYFGDEKSANSKCVHLASIYNTLLEATPINNDMIIQPSFLKNMKIDYITPDIPILNINAYGHVFKIIVFSICILYLCVMYKFKYNHDAKKSLYSFLLLLTIVFVAYHLYKVVIVNALIMKATVSINKYYEPHHACHESCKVMFNDDLNYNLNDKLKLLKDIDENKLTIANHAKINTINVQTGIEYVKNNCNFNCGNANIVLALNTFNNDAYNNVPFSTISLLDSLSHMYFLSDRSETDKKEYHDNIIRYFRINVL